MRIDQPTFSPGGLNTAASASFATSASRAVSASFATSASFLIGGGGKTITDIKSNPGNGLVVIADGVPHIIRGAGNVCQVGGTGLGTPGPLGATNMFEVALPPAESGSILDSGPYGGENGYILYTNGNLYVCGINTFGQLGLGDITTRNVYTLSNTQVTRVYVDASNSDYERDRNRLIIQKTDGKIYGCGLNLYGQLGLGNQTTNITTWTEMAWCGVNPMSVWNMGATIGSTYCQLANGTVRAAGWNREGALGNGSTADAVSGSVDVTNNWLGGTFASTGMVIQKVVGGYGLNANGVEITTTTNMFLDNGTTSRIASAGSNNHSSLGDTTTTNRSTPVVPTGFSGRVAQFGRIGGSRGSVYVLKTDGTVWNWGYNLYGQLGRGGTTDQATPAQAATGITRMLGEYYSSMFFAHSAQSPILERSIGGYLISGRNVYSSLGVGDVTDRSAFTLMRFPGGTVLNKVGIMATNNDEVARYALDTNNNFYVWGDAINNGLFDNSLVDVPVPIRVAVPALLK